MSGEPVPFIFDGREVRTVTIKSGETDNQSGALPKVTRFLTREEALAINPELAKVVLKEQAPLGLPRTQVKANTFNS